MKPKTKAQELGFLSRDYAVAKDKKFYVQAGAGIVADSKPINEYKETVNKAKALINALK